MKRVFIIMIFCTLLLPAQSADKILLVLFPRREAVLSAQVEAVLRKQDFRTGDMFPAGALLAELDNRMFQLEYKRAEARLKYTERVLKNTQREFDGGLTSMEKLHTAEIEHTLAKSAFEQAQLRRSYCSIKAPFSGKVQEFMVKEHELLRPGQPICRIIDDRVLHAVCYVPLQNKMYTTCGNTVKIKINFVSGTIQGKVHEVTPQADHRTGTVKVTIVIDNPDYKLRAGMTGEICK